MGYQNSSEIGQRIRQIRQNAGLTQEALAEKVGVTFQQIQKYESGATKLNTEKLQKVAEALTVPVSALFEDEGTAGPLLSSQERKLLEMYREVKDQKLRESLLVILAGLSRRKS